MALFETLTDDFASLDLGVWNVSGFGDTVEVVGGELVLNADGGGAGFSQMTTDVRYSLDESYIFFKVVDFSGVAGPGTDGLIYLADTSFNQIGWDMTSAGVVRAWDNGTFGSTRSISAGNYLRIRETGGTIYWETSTNGTSWSLLSSRAVASTSLNAINNLLLSFLPFASSGGAGYLIIDDINIAPSAIEIDDERDAETTGADTANAERDAETHGSEVAINERDSEAYGISDITSQRSAEADGELAPVLAVEQVDSEVRLTWTY